MYKRLIVTKKKKNKDKFKKLKVFCCYQYNFASKKKRTVKGNKNSIRKPIIIISLSNLSIPGHGGPPFMCSRVRISLAARYVKTCIQLTRFSMLVNEVKLQNKLRAILVDTQINIVVNGLSQIMVL